MPSVFGCLQCIDAGSGSRPVTAAAGGISALTMGAKLGIRKLRLSMLIGRKEKTLDVPLEELERGHK